MSMRAENHNTSKMEVSQKCRRSGKFGSTDFSKPRDERLWYSVLKNKPAECSLTTSERSRVCSCSEPPHWRWAEKPALTESHDEWYKWG